MALERLRFASIIAAFLPVLAMAAPGDPTEEEMVRALAPRPAKAEAAAATPLRDADKDDDDAAAAAHETPELRLRGRKAVTAKAARDASEGAREGRLQLSVQFELGSAAILEESRALLARLGKAMASPALSGLSYRIEGHTDSTGGPGINQRLSERRAESVTAFLIAATGIPEDRFVPVGFGSTQLLDPSNPEAAVNRRVVVVSLERPAPAAASPAAAPKAARVPEASVESAASAGAAIALGEGGRLQHVKGALDIRKAKAAGGGRAEAGARVEEGDVLTTGPGASALVQLDDGANVLLRPDSSVKLARLKHSGEGLGQLVQVITGACRYVTGSLGRANPEAVTLSTPSATIGIRGTDLEIVHREAAGTGPAAGTYVRVNDGGVRVGGLDGTRVDLAKGQQAYAGKPMRGLRGEPPGPAVKRVDDVAGVFASGDLDSLVGATR